ncbi:S8 family peptidase [Amycolatopsis sp. DSM 110486]|uniref:S8 family peptidase n=1 Tax=Amycolatopsis sp. DSM 110486 TaxID=2865832 RepID=UPI001C6A0ABF|nr:S8 family peptidase [Amycolatopsis sp. DSM 110486]QYN16602.1 S8 family peptidase [Amycolatopsis sp. DSM 110486]
MRNRTARGLFSATTVFLLVVVGNSPALAASGTQVNPPSWALDRIDQRTGLDQKYRYESDAADVTVYVIDSGVDAKHPDFQGRVQPGKDFLTTGADTSDTNGHGTRVAGIVAGRSYGVAKAAQIFPVRVLDKDGGGSTDNIIAGINWVAQNAHQPAVAVLGIGGVANEQLDNAVAGLAAVMPTVVPAGEGGEDDSQVSPARVPAALTVAASDVQDQVANFSDFGTPVDLYAPGVDIPAPIAGSSDVGTLSGTSMAAAVVAGAAAVYRSLHPDAAPADVDKALVQAATPDVLKNVPSGTANRLLCTLAAPTS